MIFNTQLLKHGVRVCALFCPSLDASHLLTKIHHKRQRAARQRSRQLSNKHNPYSWILQREDWSPKEANRPFGVLF